MALFQPGQSGNPNGRPPGSKSTDRLNYLNIQVWFKKMYEDLSLVKDADKRISFEMQIADKLLAKIANLPTSPEESLANAKDRQSIIAALEEGPKVPNENPGGTDVVNTQP